MLHLEGSKLSWYTQVYISHKYYITPRFPNTLFVTVPEVLQSHMIVSSVGIGIYDAMLAGLNPSYSRYIAEYIAGVIKAQKPPMTWQKYSSFFLDNEAL